MGWHDEFKSLNIQNYKEIVWGMIYDVKGSFR
jgi:hypothetical protein